MAYSFVDLDFSDVKLSDFQMRELTYNEAKLYVSKNHYSHTMPSTAKISLGFFYDGQLVTAIIYGSPVGRQVIQWLDANQQNCLELLRLFSEDGLPKNTESYCIGQSFKYLKENYPSYKYLISYADPNFGHVGTIYQATNWHYIGTQRRILPERRIFIDGKEVHTRTLNARHGSAAGEFLEGLYGDRIKIIDADKKHVYLKCLGNKRECKHWYAKFSKSDYPKKSE